MGREEEEGRETLDLCIKRVHQARPSRWRRLDVSMGVCMCTLTCAARLPASFVGADRVDCACLRMRVLRAWRRRHVGS